MRKLPCLNCGEEWDSSDGISKWSCPACEKEKRPVSNNKPMSEREANEMLARFLNESIDTPEQRQKALDDSKPMSVEEAKAKVVDAFLYPYYVEYKDRVERKDAMDNIIAAVQSERDEQWRAKMLALAEKWDSDGKWRNTNGCIQELKRIAKEGT